MACIARHSILAEFVSDLVSRSSLIIALYWHRPHTTCESHAHHIIVDAIADKRPMLAYEVMKTHLSDLQSNLALSLLDTEPKSLAEALGS
ncbi:MAG: FCD domain-containing protein [Microvirga sp.]